jgi:glutaredoxin-like protein
MPLISEEDQIFLKDKFAKDLVNMVNVTLFTQGESPLSVPGPECAYCKDTRQLLEEISALSDMIGLDIQDFVADSDEAKRFGVDKIPAIIVEGTAGGRVRYFGIPAGYEFGSLIEDIVDASRGTTKLSPDTKAALQKLDKDVHIQVFVTPT